jgi:hypothetical protein
MKLKSTLSFFAVIIFFVLTATNSLQAQQYKLRQATTMAGMKSESTIYIKGMRKRTEGGGYMGILSPLNSVTCNGLLK